MSSVTPPAEIEPDTKDWTWVLERACAECGFDAGAIDRVDLGAMLRDNAAGWQRVLAAPEATQRPGPAVWSPTEYAAHVRDVHRMFAGRVRLMLSEDDPTFANWDQDETALAERYDLQGPAQVAPDQDRPVQTTGAQLELPATGVPQAVPVQTDPFHHRSRVLSGESAYHPGGGPDDVGLSVIISPKRLLPTVIVPPRDLLPIAKT